MKLKGPPEHKNNAENRDGNILAEIEGLKRDGTNRDRDCT